MAAAVLTMVAYLIGIGGYALLIQARSPGRDRASLIDATVISTGVGMLAWVFLASPYSADASLPLVERVLSMLYVVLDVLVLALVIRLAIGGGDRSRAYLLMTTGWLVLVAADAGRALLVLLGTYDPSSPVEAGWLVAYALWGAAVLDPSVATLTDPVPAPRKGLTQTRLACLAGASLMAPAILAVQAVRDQRLDIPVIVAGCALLFLLVLIRMADLVRENETTVRELRGTEGVLRPRSPSATPWPPSSRPGVPRRLTDLANRPCSTTGSATPGQGRATAAAWPSSSSTWTTSRWSTTASAMAPATGCCARSRPGCAAACASPTPLAASAATSSPSSPRTPTWPPPACSPSG